ncbi:hypothetical protein [Parasitella parasitica]|uniref:NAD(P)-binding domain-containing protein n=1 Tax=Parasitella parasitica TaxID=35722 RepID=A0A0B7NFW1_9FUNG|nr:hypothetical protein [Parasitella parasitica]
MRNRILYKKFVEKIWLISQFHHFGHQKNVKTAGFEIQPHSYCERGPITEQATTSRTLTLLLIVDGGAGSLLVDEEKNVRLLETEAFPKEFLSVATKQARSLDELRASQGLNWTFISPADHFDPAGNKTGEYKTSNDKFNLNRRNESYISYANHAIAVADEIAYLEHLNTGFAVVSV